MIINKNFEGLTQNSTGNYVFNGDLVSDEDIFIELDNDLTVNGSIIADEDIFASDSIQVSGSVIAGCRLKTENDVIAGHSICAAIHIWAGGDVIARESSIIAGEIKTNRNLTSGGGIQSQGLIFCKKLSAKTNIFAGLCAWETPNKESQQIICEELVSGTIAFGDLVIA